jgi:V8-like Glu-specific endopeptidase
MALLAATGCSHPAPPPPPQRSSPVTATAGPVDPDPHIGAVFLGATDMHTCAAAVLHSATGDLIVTAAHCLAGGSDATFVPGFSGDGGPAGTWHVDAVYLDPRWLGDRNPVADYAIARVGHDGPGSLEDAVGRGLALGSAPKAGSAVTVTAYPLGTGGSPIGCRGATGITPGGYPSLRCAGFVDGTSGAPWVAGSAVVGVIGGLHGGGCGDNMSYSPPFDDATARLLARAEARGPADTPPESFSDDC